MWKKIRFWDRLLDTEIPVLLLMFLIVVLRLPNFFEPYWYGDEGIYLTIGTALRDGALLYTDIIDHKTPLLYYFAMVPTQFWFRFLMTLWMMVGTFCWFHSSYRLTKSSLGSFIGGLFFVLLTTIPWFEGNIPNGELFVIGFVLVALSLLLHTKLFSIFFNLTKKSHQKPAHIGLTQLSTFLSTIPDSSLFLSAGLFLGAAVLTKVPALLDSVALLLPAFFIVTSMVPQLKSHNANHHRVFWQETWQVIQKSGLIGLALLGTVLLSIVYYISRGSGEAYLNYGLLYNFRYVQSWSLPFENPILVTLFSLPGKFVVTSLVIILLAVFAAFVGPILQFSVGWFMLSLFGALLSNRPYPHYFLQVIPALTLLISIASAQVDLFLRSHSQKWQLRSYTGDSIKSLYIAITALILCSSLLYGTLQMLKIRLYPANSYYQNSWNYLTGKIEQQEYFQQFNWLMADNYAAANIIKNHKQDSEKTDPKTKHRLLFIWGTNPLLYALTQSYPPGKFTVSFHIKDFDAYTETLTALQESQPQFIVVMNDEHVELPGLERFLDANYRKLQTFDAFTLWHNVEYFGI